MKNKGYYIIGCIIGFFFVLALLGLIIMADIYIFTGVIKLLRTFFAFLRA